MYITLRDCVVVPQMLVIIRLVGNKLDIFLLNFISIDVDRILRVALLLTNTLDTDCLLNLVMTYNSLM